MKPKTLSASAAGVYELCSARYNAEYIERAPNMSGSAADLGTACHDALEHFVALGHYRTPDKKVLLKLYDEAYWKYFSDRDRYDDGVAILSKWFDREAEHLSTKKVLSTEVKENFVLNVAGEEVNVTFIWDRCDELPDGSIEVVDYKSWIMPVQPEDMKKKIQPRLYALAAAIKYPKRDAYWVTYDQLRYDSVGIRFTREDNIETWKYLQALYQRVLADAGITETLNPECRWCIRKGVCGTLMRHVAAGGILGVDDLTTAADKRADIDYAISALMNHRIELDQFILEQCEAEDIIEFRTDKTEVKVSVTARREVDSERAAHVLPADMLARYAKLSVSAIDEILKKGGLDPATQSQLKQLIRKKHGAPSIKTKPLSAFAEDD